MAVPTFVAEYDSGWSNGGGTGAANTVSATTAVGDVLVVLSAAENNGTTLNLPTGGTPTYVNQENLAPTDFARCRIDTAVTGITAQTYTLSITAAAVSGLRGMLALRFSGSDGIGAAESTTGTGGPSLGITTTQDNSALAVIVGDWNAADGATRTWRTVNGTTPTAGNGFEVNYFRNSSSYATYCAYYPDAGTAGAKTVGLSAPTGQKFTIAAVEIKGTAGGGGGGADPVPRGALVCPSAAVMRSVW